MKANPTRALAVAAGLVIIALTAAAFWLSYAHLAEVALAHGMRGKDVRAWAWPACLDLFIMAGELMWLRAAMLHRVDWWAICLTAAGSGGSIALNVAGVGGSAELLDYVVAAVPPTAALLAFGALMRQVHQALTGRVVDLNVVNIHDENDQAVEVTADRGDMTTVAGPIKADVIRSETVTPEPAPLVIPERRVQYMWDSFKEQNVPVPADKVTSAVPAEQHRQVVTEVVTLTPSELRRQARRMHQQAVTSTWRPVTIKALQDEFGLSRRDATELRREVVGERS